jgi:hypothetical protein
MEEVVLESGVALELPDGWFDITHEVDADDPPFTLAKNDGVGALQFSFGLYSGGERPNATISQLQEMLSEFLAGRGRLSEVSQSVGSILVAAASASAESEMLRAWYVSDGSSFAKVTYLCDARFLKPAELSEAEAIVLSLRFPEQFKGSHA